MRRAARKPADRGLSTEDWLQVAKATLIKEGVSAVKIDRLARAAGVTRGGFYYRFKSRQALLDALLADWRATNTQPFLDTLLGAGSPPERFHALIRLWIEEREYRPDYDTAVRSWSRVSVKVANAVHEADDLRIDALKRLFLDAGYDEGEAFIRARITYFHQVGYYALGVRETTKRRQELSELYYRVLTGFRDGEMKAAIQRRPREVPSAAAASPAKAASRRRKAR
jgi:AcrR family transcriptional regulator